MNINLEDNISYIYLFSITNPESLYPFSNELMENQKFYIYFFLRRLFWQTRIQNILEVLWNIIHANPSAKHK